jgi:hypothetical protein
MSWWNPLSPIIAALSRIEAKMTTLDDAIGRLQTSVANLTTVDQSAIALLQGLKKQLDDAIQAAKNSGATPVQLQALTDLSTAIDTKDTELAAAVTANTPAATS